MYHYHTTKLSATQRHHFHQRSIRCPIYTLLPRPADYPKTRKTFNENDDNRNLIFIRFCARKMVQWYKRRDERVRRTSDNGRHQYECTMTFSLFKTHLFSSVNRFSNKTPSKPHSMISFALSLRFALSLTFGLNAGVHQSLHTHLMQLNHYIAKRHECCCQRGSVMPWNYDYGTSCSV